MNSRRRIAHPKAQDYADFKVGLQQGFATGETGFRISLHGSNLAPLMSALGQKRTLRDVRPMSALPPKADILRRSKGRCYSITSSAIEITPGGMVRPSALAVVMLMTKSNLFDCSTGSSAGLAPLRMLPA